MASDTSQQEMQQVLQKAWDAFHVYRNFSLRQRAGFMRAIAAELDACGDGLIRTAMRETNLPEARLRGERARTIYQLESYAAACEKGDWLEARIDTALPEKNPPKPDIRKMLVPLGPVVVFGASNFPFAYSTAGGDTASAFAAGCPVIVKGHPAHPDTSEQVAEAILRAVQHTGMPEGVFSHVTGISYEVGKTLVTHPYCKAVGFTGSFAGGKQLFDWASQRPEPIPVFAEMGSVNPVFLLPEKLSQSAPEIAAMYAGSITLGVGQFCTNPGLLIGVESEALQQFIHDLGKAIRQCIPGLMLHQGIAGAYSRNREAALMQENVHLVAEPENGSGEEDSLYGQPTLATVDGKTFLGNPLLHKEVFGPYSLVVRCASEAEMLEVARQLEGQLTCTLMATDEEVRSHTELVNALKNLCGRLIWNAVPTGVEVCLSMQHGGPFPASTDARFGSVGADAIKRFARPLAFQNWPDALLPDELKNGNPLGIWRTVNNEPTRMSL